MSITNLQRRTMALITGLAFAASCSQPARVETPPPSSLDSTVTWLIDAINEKSNVRVEMGDKIVKHSTVVTRADRCVLAIHDKQHTQLGGSWEEADVQATLDLRQLSPKITAKEFEGSGYRGAHLTLSTPDGRAAIPQDAHFNSSGVGPVHTTEPAKAFDLTIADKATAERIADALTRAIEMCRGL